MTAPLRLPTGETFTELSPAAMFAATAASSEDGLANGKAPTAFIAARSVAPPPQLSFSPDLAEPAKNSSFGSASAPPTPSGVSEGPAARMTRGFAPLVPEPPTT